MPTTVILVATDLSDPSLPAVRARGGAGPTAGQPLDRDLRHRRPAPTLDAFADLRVRRDARASIASMRAKSLERVRRGPAGRARRRVRRSRGASHAEIVALARRSRRRSDRRGHARPRFPEPRVLAGSTAERVLHHAPCPVRGRRTGGTPEPSCACAYRSAFSFRPDPFWVGHRSVFAPPRPIPSRSTTCWRWSASRTRRSRPTAAGSSSPCAAPISTPIVAAPTCGSWESDGGAAPADLARCRATVNPRWSPDGNSVWFLSSRSGSIPGLAHPDRRRRGRTGDRLPAGRDEPRRLARRQAHRAVSMDVFVDCETIAVHRRGWTRSKAEQDHRPGLRPAVHPPLGHLEGRPPLAPVRARRRRAASRGRDARDGRRLPSEAVRRAGGVHLHAGRPGTLVFSGRDAGREEAWSTDFDLYRAPVDGSAAPRNLTDVQPGLGHPAGLLAGRQDAGLPGHGARRLRVGPLAHRPARLARRRRARADRELGPLGRGAVWSADGKTLYATPTTWGSARLFAIDVASGGRCDRGRAGDGALDRPGRRRLVYGLDILRSPGRALQRRSVRRQRRAPASPGSTTTRWRGRPRMGEAEQFTFKGWNDETVHAYVVKPADFDPQRKRYPVAFLIHGGRRARSATTSTTAGTRRPTPARATPR